MAKDRHDTQTEAQHLLASAEHAMHAAMDYTTRHGVIQLGDFQAQHYGDHACVMDIIAAVHIIAALLKVASDSNIEAALIGATILADLRQRLSVNPS